MSEKYKSEVAITRNKPSNIEAIRDWYLKEGSRHATELTEAQEEHRQQLVLVKAKLLERSSEEEIRKILEEDHNLSSATAYRRIREAIQLYGDLKKADKEGRRYIIYEWTVYTYQKAAEALDFREMNRSVQNMITLLGLDKEDADTPDFERLEPAAVLAILPEDMTKAIMTALGKGPLNFNQPMAEDIDYDEIITESGSAAAEED